MTVPVLSKAELARLGQPAWAMPPLMLQPAFLAKLSVV
jgi:hypothetical protein